MDRGAEALRFPGELPLVWSVPFHANRFLTGRALVGQFTVVASEPGTATLQPLDDTRLSKIARGDQIVVSRLPQRTTSTR